MTVTVEMKIVYFSTESMGHYTINKDFDTYAEAAAGAIDMVHEAEQDAYDDGAMMDTFYYEYDFLMDRSVAIENNLAFA